MTDASANHDAPPRNATMLAAWLDQAANTSGIAAGRLRRRLGFMILAAMLDTARHAGDGRPLFLVKGGVAMELRTQGSARATRDFDTALRADTADLAAHLDPALRSGFGDFTATRTQIEPVRDTGALRCEIKIAYRNKPVVTVPFEIARVEAGMGDDVDDVPALSLAHVGIEGPATVACIAVRWQIAQKLHACTEQPVDRVNDRFRDLLDLQILGELVGDNDWHEVRVASVDVFAGRAKHAWPATVTIPEPWHAGYRTMTEDIGFNITNVADAAAAVEQLITRIDSATST
jgi:hypothetical protein